MVFHMFDSHSAMSSTGMSMNGMRISPSLHTSISLAALSSDREEQLRKRSDGLRKGEQELKK